MKLRRTAAVLAAILVTSLLVAGCGPISSTTTGSIAGCVVKHSMARSLSSPELQDKAVIIVPEPPADSSYVGLPGVRVVAESTGYPSRTYIATTNRYGDFRMSQVEPGEYVVKIADDRFILGYAIQCRVQAGRSTYVGTMPMGSLHLLSVGVSMYRNPSLASNLT
ncbi:MAG TPA: carboxypeptidase-like regulatory domain-containing protein, partial [Bacillota bacterium]|nr:carboxypeptidase-like regulatory domain-containing protein [Bacillota bacterium]